MILIADDEHDIRMIISNLLDIWGYSTIAFESGEHAARYLTAGGMDRISMLVTDFSMPGMNGLELIEHARALCPTLPVLMISGHTTTNIPKDIPYLNKPFRANSLKSIIQNHYGNRKKTHLEKQPTPIFTKMV